MSQKAAWYLLQSMQRYALRKLEPDLARCYSDALIYGTGYMPEVKADVLDGWVPNKRAKS